VIRKRGARSRRGCTAPRVVAWPWLIGFCGAAITVTVGRDRRIRGAYRPTGLAAPVSARASALGLPCAKLDPLANRYRRDGKWKKSFRWNLGMAA
jgi:hypothetical protein